MENVHPGIIDPNNNLGLGTYPMTTADQAALGDPLENLALLEAPERSLLAILKGGRFHRNRIH